MAATLRRLLRESGDPEQMAGFDVDAWLAHSMREALPELGDRTPVDMLKTTRACAPSSRVLERMRGGLPA